MPDDNGGILPQVEWHLTVGNLIQIVLIAGGLVWFGIQGYGNYKDDYKTLDQKLSEQTRTHETRVLEDRQRIALIEQRLTNSEKANDQLRQETKENMAEIRKSLTELSVGFQNILRSLPRKSGWLRAIESTASSAANGNIPSANETGAIDTAPNPR